MRTSNSRERTIGVHGLDLLLVLFRLGCATVRDLAGILGLETGTVGDQLSTLCESGYLERRRCLPSWEKSTGGSLPYLYLLTRRGVAIGGGLAGAEDEKAARAGYASCRPESLYSHRLMQTRYLRYLTEAVRGSIFEVTYFGAEHADGFPLELWKGSSIPASGVLSPADLRRTIRPDGLMRLEARGGGISEDTSLDIILELETGSRNLCDVLSKVVTYLSYFEIHLSTGKPLPLPDDPGGVSYRICPGEGWPAVLFLSPTEEASVKMRSYVVERLEEHDGYQRWVWRMQEQHDLDPAWFFLFGSLEACGTKSAEPFEEIYLPMEPHQSTGGSRENPEPVSLVDVMALSDAFSSRPKMP